MTGLNSVSNPVLTDFQLYDNFPNPFNPQTAISFYLPRGTHVKLRVYDIIGNEVASLTDDFKPAGLHSVIFNASHLPSGAYLYKIETDAFSDSRKMLLIK
ncbi:MAG: T9SS type A sorting domain-containing protein [Ignavibacteria bacterium]|nr:T9SS type A sorting domain-containing protein [Ignavibacteria bacterium]